VVQRQNVFSGTWAITPERAISGRWVEYDGGYYRVSYRRMVKRGIDMFAVFSDDPYTEESVNLKLVWNLLPFPVK
jgi:hypothetical protein